MCTYYKYSNFQNDCTCLPWQMLIHQLCKMLLKRRQIAYFYPGQWDNCMLFLFNKHAMGDNNFKHNVALGHQTTHWPGKNPGSVLVLWAWRPSSKLRDQGHLLILPSRCQHVELASPLGPDIRWLRVHVKVQFVQRNKHSALELNHHLKRSFSVILSIKHANTKPIKANLPFW